MTKETMDTSTPVVVLRSPHHGSVGIARSLGRLGVPVYCVDKERWTPAYYSRYCRGHFNLDFENEPAGQSVGRCHEIGRQLGNKPFLSATTYTASIWVAEHDEALRTEFRFPHQDATLVRSLCDKGRMQELAARNGVPVARSVVPRSREELLRFLAAAEFPLVA